MKGLKYITAAGIMVYTLSTGCRVSFDVYVHQNPEDNKKQKSDKTLESRTNDPDKKTYGRISNKIDFKINFYKDAKDRKIISYDSAKREDRAYDTKKQEEQIKDNSKEQKRIDEKKSEPIKKKKKRSFWHDGSLYQYEVDAE